MATFVPYRQKSFARDFNSEENSVPLPADRYDTAPAQDNANGTGIRSKDHSHNVARLLKDELIRVRHKRLFYKENPSIDRRSSFKQTFGSHPPYELENTRYGYRISPEKDLHQFTPMGPDNRTPMERFLIIDPVNEPCYVFGKQQMSKCGLSLGDVASAKGRLEAAATVARETNRKHYRQRHLRCKSTKLGRSKPNGETQFTESGAVLLSDSGSEALGLTR